jgi:hypothetical protein
MTMATANELGDIFADTKAVRSSYYCGEAPMGVATPGAGKPCPLRMLQRSASIKLMGLHSILSARDPDTPE